jgi:hypothetical protein
MSVETILMIESKWCTGQDANNLTINLNEELRNVESIQILYAGIPCTWYNVSEKIGNNSLKVYEANVPKYINFPDGHYDLETFDKQFATQMKINGLPPKAIKFDMDQATGKIYVIFRKQKGKIFSINIGGYNNELLGFNLVKYGVELPRRIRDPNNSGQVIREDISIGCKPINLKPFEYFHIHCDIVDGEHNLYNCCKSSLLARLPIKKCDFGGILTYYPTLRGKQCVSSFNKLRIWITDEENTPIDFNGANVQF